MLFTKVFSRFCKEWYALAMVAILAGCSSATLQPKSAEEAVAARAQAYWDGVIANNFRATYDLMTPGYRERYTYERHILKVQAVAVFLGAEVAKVECKQPDMCLASMRLRYKDLNLGKRVDKSESSSMYRDKWVLVDGQWWRVTPN